MIASLGAAEGIAIDAAGNVYIADNLDHRVRKVTPNGVIVTVAGNGHAGYAGDGGPASEAVLNRPYGLAVDSAGNLYVADFGNGRVRRISPDGAIRTVAGGGSGRQAGVGEALSARLIGPRNVAVDGFGNIYIADFLDHRVYRVAPGGQIVVVAGTGVAGYNGEGNAVSSHLTAPAGIAVDRQGALAIADTGNNRIRRVFGGAITTLVGGDSDPINLKVPLGLCADAAGNLLIADSQNARLLKRTPDGRIALIGPVGGAAPSAATFTAVREVAVDIAGNILIAGGRKVWRWTAGGRLENFAGSGAYAVPIDGVPATQSHLNGPIGVAFDSLGGLFIADEANQRIRKIAPDGKITTVAGTGAQGFSGDGGPAAAAQLIDPVAVAADPSGGFYISDYLGHRIRRVSPGGYISTLAGNGTAGFADNGAAGAGQLNRPRGLALDRHGSLYIADSGNHRVRRISTQGIITTVAGTGVRGYAGDGGPAPLAQLDTPAAVCVDAGGGLYIAEHGNHVIRHVTPAGGIVTVAGSGLRGYSGDRGPATLAMLNHPSGIACAAAGTLFIADSDNHRIRRVDPEAVIDTIAGSGAAGYGGDGGLATMAQLRFPSGVALGPDASVYIADLDNNRVRKLSAYFAPPPVEQLDPITILHAASFRASPLAPGQIVSIFGRDMGPEEGAGSRLSASGFIDSTVADTEVRFDGVPAALFFVQDTQINAQVPYSVAGKRKTTIEVIRKGKVRSRISVDVAPASPGIFTSQRGTGAAVVLNEDGSLNSERNPAGRGSIVTIYATGEGQTDPAGSDGKIAEAPWARPVLPVELRIAGLAAQILYAGSAPGFAGLMQINARVPGPFAPTGSLSLVVYVGGAPSQAGVTVSVK